jgi:hypothetical protein
MLGAIIRSTLLLVSLALASMVQDPPAQTQVQLQQLADTSKMEDQGWGFEVMDFEVLRESRKGN